MRGLGSLDTDGRDSKALNQIAIACSHVRLECEITVMGTIKIRQDKRCCGIPYPRIRCNWAGREIVSELHAIALTGHKSRRHGEQSGEESLHVYSTEIRNVKSQSQSRKRGLCQSL